MPTLRWAGLLALAAVAFWLGRGSADLSAQPLLPDGVFVRDSGGGVWLIIGGQRAQVPFLPAGDDVIFAVPDSGQWVVQGEGGILTLGAMPEYVYAPPVALPPAPEPTATPTPAPAAADPGPSVIIQVDDTRIQAGQTVSVTVIGNDSDGIEWIQWEGTIEGEGDNDNQATGDPELDAEHRFDCDNRTQCANVWQVTPKTAGRFLLRARGRDSAGNRSEWVQIDFRVQAGPATPTPTPAGPAPAVGSPTP
jgi:hypothetical protein